MDEFFNLGHSNMDHTSGKVAQASLLVNRSVAIYRNNRNTSIPACEGIKYASQQLYIKRPIFLRPNGLHLFFCIM